MKDPTNTAMPHKAAKAAGGKHTKAKDHSGVNKKMVKEKTPQLKGKVTFGQKTPTQKS